MWSKEANRFFRKIEKFAYGEINEGSLINPHPRWSGSKWSDYLRDETEQEAQATK